MPDEAGKPKYRFELRTALWWSLLPFAALYAYVKLDGLLAPGTNLCLHWDSPRQCNYSLVSINSYWALVLCVFGPLSILWLICRFKGGQSRDPHPLIVALGFLGGGFVTIFALQFVDGINVGGTTLLASAGAVVGAAIASGIRSPYLSVWRAVATIAVPLAPVVFYGFSVQSPDDVKNRLGEWVSGKLSQAAADAADQADRYPDKLAHAHATAWFGTPTLGANDAQRDAIEAHIGPIDAVSTGLDIHRAFRHLLETRSNSDGQVDNQGIGDIAETAGREGVWINLYVFGRDATGHCLAKVKSLADDDEPFSIYGTTVVPNVRTSSELAYCIFDDALLAFDEPSAQPRRLDDVGCLPAFGASPYSDDPIEEAVSFFLRATAAGDKKTVDDMLAICLAFKDQVYRAPDDARLRSARLPDSTRDQLEAEITDWPGNIHKRLGWFRGPLAEASSNAYTRAGLLQDAIIRTHRAPTLPGRDHIEPVFGTIMDLGHTHATELALRRRLDSYPQRRSGEERLEEFAGGVDFVRHIVGTRRAGWCKFDARVKPTLADSGEWFDVDADYRVRFCRAGDELVAFDDDGAVERTWDARGLTYIAPLVEPPLDVEGVEADDELLIDHQVARARTALIDQFYDALVAGRLDDVAQLRTLAMAEGAETLDKRSLRAMRRMVEQNAEAAATP